MEIYKIRYQKQGIKEKAFGVSAVNYPMKIEFSAELLKLALDNIDTAS